MDDCNVLKGREIWPLTYEPNYSRKKVYWAFPDPFTYKDLKDADAYLFIGGTGAGKTT
jgi:hypothetical protein